MSIGSEIKVTFGALATAQSDVSGTASRITEQLEDLRRFLAPMVATWQGAAAQDYQVRQKQWDTAAADLTAVLGQIGVALGAANDGYRRRNRPTPPGGGDLRHARRRATRRWGGGRFDPAPDRRVPSFFDVQWVKLRAARSPGVPAAPAHQTPFERTPAGEARANDSNEVGPCPRTARSLATSPTPGT